MPNANDQARRKKNPPFWLESCLHTKIEKKIADVRLPDFFRYKSGFRICDILCTYRTKYDTKGSIIPQFCDMRDKIRRERR